MKIILLILLIATSCSRLTESERGSWQELKDYGVWERDIPNKKKTFTAGGLNILPGFGNFYLAMGTNTAKSHWFYGALNLVSWPFSILWGVPEAMIDADNINKKELVYYYNATPEGRYELEELRIKNSLMYQY